MKWDCDARYERKYTRLSDWHRWFAWYPVRIDYGDCRWLETVERRGSLVCQLGWEYTYRALQTATER